MAATDALVFDAIRTPRGKGKFNGSLHDHLAHLIHPEDARLDGARERLVT
jgi:hypothetical protein